MWLLNTRTITLSQQSENPVPYAILSHRWGHDFDEVSFSDIHAPGVAQRKLGFDKIKRFCRQALTDGYEYAWVDTCCIDKSSSADLQEAINSMYLWYEQSGVCYAYLEDVPPFPGHPIEKSEWFTRGWTLQELLAPKDVRFFDASWSLLGDRLSLVDSIHEATNIRKDLLRGEVKLQDCSIAERMSWAAKRRTKRVEDRAYSLFGIFGIHLTMLYGEKEKAFQRLQREILKTAEDDTLFTWTGVSNDYGGLLAPDLEAFKDGALFRSSAGGPNLRLTASDSTRRRIVFTAHLYPWCTDTYLIFLGCEKMECVGADATRSIVGIYLRTLKEDDDFARVRIAGQDLAYFTAEEYSSWLSMGRKVKVTPYKPISKETWMMKRSVSVRQLPLSQAHEKYLKDRIYGFSISMPVERHLAYFIDNATVLEDYMSRQNNVYNMSYDETTSKWDQEKRILWAVNGVFLERGIIGTLKSPHSSKTHTESKTIREIHFGFDHFFNPTLLIRHNEVLNAKENIDCFCDGTEQTERSVVVFNGKKRKKGVSEPASVKPIDEADFWTETSAQPENPQIVARPERNFWAFKGDRQSGLDVCLAGWGGVRIRLTRLEVDSKLVWDLSMDEYQGNVVDGNQGNAVYEYQGNSMVGTFGNSLGVASSGFPFDGVSPRNGLGTEPGWG